METVWYTYYLYMHLLVLELKETVWYKYVHFCSTDRL